MEIDNIYGNFFEINLNYGMSYIGIDNTRGEYSSPAGGFREGKLLASFTYYVYCPLQNLGPAWQGGQFDPPSNFFVN